MTRDEVIRKFCLCGVGEYGTDVEYRIERDKIAIRTKVFRYEVSLSDIRDIQGDRLELVLDMKDGGRLVIDRIRLYAGRKI